jgi:hypothetical protein
MGGQNFRNPEIRGYLQQSLESTASDKREKLKITSLLVMTVIDN